MPDIKAKPAIQTFHTPADLGPYSHYLTEPESPRSPRRANVTVVDPATGRTWTVPTRCPPSPLVLPKRLTAASETAAAKAAQAVVSTAPAARSDKAHEKPQTWAHRFVPLFELMKMLGGYGLPILAIGLSTLPFPFNAIGIGCAVLGGVACGVVLWLAHRKRHAVAPMPVATQG